MDSFFYRRTSGLVTPTLLPSILLQPMQVPLFFQDFTPGYQPQFEAKCLPAFLQSSILSSMEPTSFICLLPPYLQSFKGAEHRHMCSSTLISFSPISRSFHRQLHHSLRKTRNFHPVVNLSQQIASRSPPNQDIINLESPGNSGVHSIGSVSEGLKLNNHFSSQVSLSQWCSSKF